MEFRLPGFNAQLQHNQVYSMPSSNYNNFSNAMEGGPVDMQREAIQRELEKEMIREKIIAEEVERFRVLQAEMRRELMIGREMMAMKSGEEFVLQPCLKPTGNHHPPPPPSSLPVATQVRRRILR